MIAETLTKIAQGMFPYVDTPATGLTVFGTGKDAAAALPIPAPAPRNASTTTANVTLLWNVNNVQQQQQQDQNASSGNNVGDNFSTSSTSAAGEEIISETAADPNVLFETWNPVGMPNHIVKRARMTRAVWDVEGFTFVEKYAKHAQGHQHIWFCGSYCSRGVTLLEQACTSALEVAQDFGCDVPFRVESNDLNSSWWILLFSMYLNLVVWGTRKYLSVIFGVLEYVSETLQGLKNRNKNQVVSTKQKKE